MAEGPWQGDGGAGPLGPGRRRRGGVLGPSGWRSKTVPQRLFLGMAVHTVSSLCRWGKICCSPSGRGPRHRTKGQWYLVPRTFLLQSHLQGLCHAPCVTLRWVPVSLRGPGQSPVLPFTCCVGSLRSVGRCGLCSCWCRFRVGGAQWLACCRCAGCCGSRFSVFAAHSPPHSGRPPPASLCFRGHVVRRVAFLHRALDSHPFFPSRAASGRCVLTAAVACVPAANAEPSSWHTGLVLVVAGVVLQLLLPTPLRTQVVHHLPGRVSVCVRPKFSTPPPVVLVVHHLPHAVVYAGPNYSIPACGARGHCAQLYGCRGCRAHLCGWHALLCG